MAKHDKKKKIKGGKMSKLVFYDKENDILSVHKGFTKDEKFKGNIDAGELILDVSTKGRIKGIEIINAANFLDIEEKIFKNITDADFNVSMKPNRILISLVLKAKNIKEEIPAKIAVPLETPISH